MDIIGKGSKPVVYKNNMKLQFYGTTVEDCRIEVDHIYAKVTEDSTVVAFGECTIHLLFSYTDSNKEKVFSSESKVIRFCEDVACFLPQNLNPDYLEPQAAFEPQIFCKRAAGSSYAWEIEVAGEFNVVVQIGRSAGAPGPFVKGDNFMENAKVMQLNDLSIPAQQLVEMDTESLGRLVGGAQSNKVPQDTEAAGNTFENPPQQ